MKCDQCGEEFEHAPYLSKHDADRSGYLYLCSYMCYLRAIGFKPQDDDGTVIHDFDTD